MTKYDNGQLCKQSYSLTIVLGDLLTDFLAPRFAAAVSICFVRFLFGPILTSINRKREGINISQNALDKII